MTSHRKRARSGAVLLALAAVGALVFVPPRPIVAQSDPTAVPTADPTPSADPSAALGPSPSASPDPTASPLPEPTATDMPTPEPTPDPSPDPSPTPDPSPSASPEPSASPSPSPSPAPTIAYSLSSGQQPGRDVGPAFPLWKLDTAPRANGAATPHTGAATIADAPDCATCHATHTGQNVALLATSPPQAALCFTCHGTGTTFDVEAAFATAPPNDPATDSYYQHPVAAASAGQHVLDSEDEFGGRSDRHAVCADCHDPHDATNVRPQQSTSAWTASGDIYAASGVQATSNGAGTTPALALIARTAGTGSLVYEYQLCLKCHSSWTILPTRSSSHPSWWALDKSVEFDPANVSYHPVEAAGKNVSAQMALSLAGTSPFKAWDFSIDSTIRCTACHGDPSTVNQTPDGSPKQPNPDAYEASHASPNRGLLIAPYRDRTLKPSGEPYQAGDFALCYLCHAEAPFVNPNVNPDRTINPDVAYTAYPLHGDHLTHLTLSTGVGTSIDQAGAGPGLAICAECHFRTHGTALSYQLGDDQPVVRSSGYAGLVDFAPDVTGVNGGLPSWIAPDATGSGSCTLTCHGYQHNLKPYTVAPATGFTASPTSGSGGGGGLTVHFSDATRYASAVTATWTWDFGDGSPVSNATDPVHVYGPGTYTVSLTVKRTADGLSTTSTRTDYITVSP